MVDTALVVLVDDDAGLRAKLRAELAREGHAVIEAGTGTHALQAIAEVEPDLVLLDVGLPDLSGFEVLRHVRRTAPRAGVILLTGRGEISDRVTGLDLGADDYVTKPFETPELLARVRAVLRRVRAENPPPDGDLIDFGDLVVDLAAREVLLRGKPVALAPREFDLLAFFAENPRRALTKDQILAAVWGPDEWPNLPTISEHVHRIRHKIEDDSRAPKWIKNVHSIGYRFDPPG